MADKSIARCGTTTPAPAGYGEPELHIEMYLDNFAEYKGTAAQLRAEGLIPEDFKWPAVYTRWDANGFDYWLRRIRPRGHKGSMRSWLEMDSWCVRVEVTGRDYQCRNRRELDRKAEELRAEYHRNTVAGRREWDANWRRYYATVEDEKFQAFKAMIPGLIPPKRGRKPKDAEAA